MESALALPFIHPPRGLDGDEFGFLAQDAQEFVGGGVRAASAGFPFGEGGLRNAEGGGKVSLIETETAVDAEDELGGGGVFFCNVDDDESAAGGIVWDAAGGAVGEGDFGDVIELRGDSSDGVAMTAVGSDFREGPDVAIIFLTPTDDSGEAGSEKSFFGLSYFWRHKRSVAAWGKRIKNSLKRQEKSKMCLRRREQQNQNSPLIASALSENPAAHKHILTYPLTYPLTKD